MFLIQNQYRISQLITAIVVIGLGLFSPIQNLVELAIWIGSICFIFLIFYLVRRQERKHFISEKAWVVEVETEWGATSMAMVTLETTTGIRLYKTCESQIAAPRLKTTVWVRYDPDDLQTFSVHMSEDRNDILWWLETVLFILIASTLLFAGYLRSKGNHQTVNQTTVCCFQLMPGLRTS